jgi:hypothetical protein
VADTPLPITPETRVGELLGAYPALEEVLVGIAPAFARLRNPILRRTVAKVATLDQAARIGGIETRELVRRLRQAAGLDVEDASPATPVPAVTAPAAGLAGAASPADRPGEPAIAAVIDADALLNRGEHPLGAVRRALASLGPAEAVCIDSSFVPAPLLDALRAEGYDVSTAPRAGRHRTYIRR